MSLSMLTACGGDDNGDDTDLSNDTELVQEDGDGAVTDETWNTMMTNATLFGKYNQAAEALGADIPDELVSSAQEINERVKEVAAKRPQPPKKRLSQQIPTFSPGLIPFLSMSPSTNPAAPAQRQTTVCLTKHGNCILKPCTPWAS